MEPPPVENVTQRLRRTIVERDPAIEELPPMRGGPAETDFRDRSAGGPP